MRKALFSAIIISIILTGGCKEKESESGNVLQLLMGYGNTFSIGGTVSGYTGSGMVLQNNGQDDLTIPADGDFVFETTVPDRSKYIVTIAFPSAGQDCSVKNGSGSVNGTNVDDVSVICDGGSGGGGFTVGGSITGLTGSGLVLQNNGGDDLPVAALSAAFTFTTPIADGSTYAVTILAQPAGQTCTVSGGDDTFGGGTISGGDVTGVTIDCIDNTPYAVGGTITGLTGSGLVLQNNGGDDLSVAALSAAFTFTTPIADGLPYAVTVLTQPAGQTCAVSGGDNSDGTGTVAGGDVTSVTVTCLTNSYTVGGSITGLTGSGLVLQNNGGDDLPVAASSATFTFGTPILNGLTYAVTVLTQPAGQICTVGGGDDTFGGGTVSGGNVSSVTIDCVDIPTYSVGGSITGLTGGGLVLQNNGGDDLSVAALSAAFTFATSIADGLTYAVTVLTQPAGQICTVGGGDDSNGGGTISGVDVASVTVTCTTVFTVGGTVSGLITGKTLVLLNNGGDSKTITADGSFTFPTPLPDLSAYSVSVQTLPSLPNTGCTVSGGDDTFGGGTIGGANVTSVTITCTNNGFCGDLGNAVYDSQITVNGPAKSGVIAANQEKAYSVDISNNSLHFIMLYGTTSPSFDGELYVCDQDGATQLAAVNDFATTHAELSGWNFSSNGKYYLVAAGNGTSAGDYRMKIVNTAVSGGGSCNVPMVGCYDFDSDYIGGAASCNTYIGGSWYTNMDCTAINAAMTRIGSCTVPYYFSGTEHGFVTFSGYSTYYTPANFKTGCDWNFGSYIWDP